MLKRFLSLALGVVATAGSGCVALAVGAGAGVGTYAFVQGATETTLEAPYNTVWAATGQVLQEYEITVSKQTRDAMGGVYKGERHDGSNVVIDVESVGRNVTKFRIRVGAFGDQVYQERLVDDVKARL